MNFTLDSINREREIDKESKRENRKNIKEMKRLMLGMVFQWQVLLSLLSSEWYSAYKEVIDMFKLFAKASFWTCYWFWSM